MHDSRHPGYHSGSHRPHPLTRVLLPISVVVAMIVIPMLSIWIWSSYEEGVAEAETILDRHGLSEISQIYDLIALRAYLDQHFTPQELDELKTAWMDGKSNERVRREIHDVSYGIVHRDYRALPRHLVTFLQERIGTDRALELKKQLEKIQPSYDDVHELGVDELLPRRELRVR